MIIDTHAHLYWEAFQKDFDEVIERALTAGVEAIINIGVDPETSQKAAQLENSQIKFYSSIGIHPHEALKYIQNGQTLHGRDTFVQKDIDNLEQIYNSNPKKVAAVGECGLDFLFDHPALLETPSKKVISTTQAKALQIQLFQAQIDLAKKLSLPLIVHCRDDRSQNPANSEVWDKTIDMTKNHQGIYHCYSGLKRTTKRIIKETRFLVSFAATLTYPRNDYLIEAVKMLPLERIVLETDCPFLPPQSKRGTRNEPAAVLEIGQKIAEIKRISLTEVAEQTTRNVLKLLSLSI